MTFDPSRWVRLEHDGIPIYLCGDKPEWFVPNSAGDLLLQKLQEGSAPTDINGLRFLDRLPGGQPVDFPGRGKVLTPTHLRELWFHITDRCNLACNHCLFSSSPDQGRSLSLNRILGIANQAHSLGTRVFALTGGEPFVHPDIDRIISGLLEFPDTHLAILTNGLNLDRHLGTLPSRILNRLHLQISLEGDRASHDAIRGEGSYDKLMVQISKLNQRNIPFTLSMCVEKSNLSQMSHLVEAAEISGAPNVHYMWYFLRGRGSREGFVNPDEIFPHLQKAHRLARSKGVSIDNFQSLTTQIFSPVGTIFDSTTSGWESAAVGPDEKLYPSPALIGTEGIGFAVRHDLKKAWKESPALESLRNATASRLNSPWRFLLGGGDPDHSYSHTGSWVGSDPYHRLYELAAMDLIADRAEKQPDSGSPALRLKMGDVLFSCGAHGNVAFTHSNCLLAFADADNRSVVKQFYSEAAKDPNQDILNPACYPEEILSHVPEKFRLRNYGCGSPVLDANIAPGESVVDLGSGAGTECFIAAKMVGDKGHVIGVDMLDQMLALATDGAEHVGRSLGYDILEFKKGYLESLPVEDGTVDVVLSNCVINLSSDKRKTFDEIRRVLKPGGRLVVSDVVSETETDPAIRNDEKLRGECIGGALTQKDLFALLEESGFHATKAIKRFPYREIGGQPFYSLTYQAFKPRVGKTLRVMYRGPFAAVATASGRLLRAGETVVITEPEIVGMESDIFVFDDNGAVTNLDIGQSLCCCSTPSEDDTACDCNCETPVEPLRHNHLEGCVVCGEPLVYGKTSREMPCEICGKMEFVDVWCEKDHYVCDSCHGLGGLEKIETIARTTDEKDMTALLRIMRDTTKLPMHGPEHHSMVPAIILAAYRNGGGEVPEEMIRTAIARGAKVSGGSCGFMGVCGAAQGVGIAFGLLLNSSPVNAVARQKTIDVTNQASAAVGALQAGRCCLRDSWLTLRKAAELSAEYLSIPLAADAPYLCNQSARNGECIGCDCPLSDCEADQVENSTSKTGS